MAMPVPELNARLERIARGWIDAMPAGQWTSAQCFWAEVVDVVYASTIAADLEGQPHDVSLPPDVHAAFREIRAGMAEPERGTWLSASATLTDGGVLEIAYNWDRRWYWGDQPGFPWAPPADADPVPSDARLLDDLARHPRSPLFLPSWFPRPADGAHPASAPGDAPAEPAPAEPASAVLASAESAPAEPASAPVAEAAHGRRFASALERATRLPDEVRPLMDAWGWPGVVELVATTLRQAIGRIPEPMADAIGGDEGQEAQRGALRELRDGVVGGALRSLVDGPALVPVRLWREWASVQTPPVADPEGLRALDDDRPARACADEPAMRLILDELARLIGEIVAGDLAARFGVELDRS